ncbi:MarR family transcriptional regulator [Arthrobacter sp. LAPM80]|uniref:MarR family winged helix-turn-helix transcriptional regulator n=1 Tax=Arthrobacter sp. LAPM80 TaxID=3141788 RepID=UPI00398B732E
MSDNLQELASRYRDILRQAVFLVRSMDAEGELSTGHLSTLNMIAAEPMRVGAIARNSGIRVPSATEQVIKLEAAGLVERIADASDARAVLVQLTPRGRTRLGEGNRLRNASMAAALETLSDEERLAISAAIPAIAKLNTALAHQPTTTKPPAGDGSRAPASNINS